MATLLAAAISSFILAFLILPVVIKYSHLNNIGDIPGRRKIHKKITPSLGGVAIFSGFFITSLIWIDIPYWKDIKFLLVPLFVVFLVGVRDDLVPLRAIIKLLGQVIAACLLVFFLDLRLTGFYGILGIYEIPLWASYALTLFTIIIITNSFNLIDGLDGLSGTLSSISLLFFGVWFFSVGEVTYAILSFSMLGGVIAFLCFNWEPSEVFMGDTGALVIGLMLAILSIHFINVNYALPIETSMRFKASVATAASAIIIPLIDTARVIILRLSKGQSPVRPDKNHVHHAISRLGFSHGKVTILLALVHLLFIGLAIVFAKLSENWVLLGLVVVSVILSILLDRLILRKKALKEI